MTMGGGERRWTVLDAIELAACFFLFAGLMHFLYLGPPGIVDADRGLPGHDAYYHVKMAALLPEIGLVDRFPWLRTTVFNERFVNHHYGFQALLSPFVLLSHKLTGDYAPGGRWFTTISFGLSMTLVQLLLMIRGVERRWVWLLLCLLLPIQFYQRHTYVRAINPSLVCQLLLCLCLFTRRFIWAAVVAATSIHVYLGAVMYVPALAGIVFVSGLVGQVGDFPRAGPAWARWRDGLRGFWGWQLIAWIVLGWLVGLATHPYGGREVLSFLDLQVFGSGLTPDIPVGQEWESYSPAWFFVNMSGVTLTVLGVAICLRMRIGPRLDTNELALFIMNLLFLVLTLKARRFIEYWPIFAILTSAYFIGSMGRRRTSPDAVRPPSTANIAATTACFLVVAGAAGVSLSVYSDAAFLAEWRLWTFLAALCVIVPIVRLCRAGAASLAAGILFTTLVGVVFYRLSVVAGAPAARLSIPWWLFAVPVAGFGLAGQWMSMRKDEADSPVGLSRWRRAAAAALVGATAVIIVVPPAGAFFTQLQDDTKSQFDLAALRPLMDELEKRSAPDDVIFTDDWDIFPVYFYLNHRDHYVVGLDPKFTHAKDPVLWERFVRVSRAQVPGTYSVTHDKDGATRKESVKVALEDIRDYFDAKFVIVDRDHKPLSDKLDRAPEFAERIFPPPVKATSSPPFVLYRVLPRSSDVIAPPPAESE